MNDARSSVFVKLALSLEWYHIPLAIAISIPAWIIYNLFFHPLAKYPGPFIARIGIPGIWPFWQTYNYRFAWALEEAHDRYGEVVRISTNHLSFNTSKAAQQIYAHGSGVIYPKTTFYQSFQVYRKQPSLFSEIDSDKHSAFRRAISGAYSMNNLIKLEEYIEPLTQNFIKRLSENQATTEKGSVVIDLAKWLHFFAMDAVGELAFGASFGFVEKGNDADNFLVGVSNLSHWGSMAGWLPAISRPLRKWIKYSSGQPGGETVGKVTEPLINERYRLLDIQSKKDETKMTKEELDDIARLDARQDMLSNFCKSKNPTTGNLLQRNEVLRTAISVVSAGSDTSATALTTMIGYLVRNPEVHKALQKEIDDAFDAGALTWPIQYAQAVKLELLQACIKETLRLHPPISMSLPREVCTKDGLVVQGHVGKQHIVPFGCQVSVAPFVLHRNKDEFGENAREYDPYRWLNLSEDKRRNLEKSILTFGGGARQCIGKNISLMEINKALPSLIRTFDFKLPDRSSNDWQGRDSDGVEAEQVPWRCRSTWFLEVQTFPVQITTRSNGDDD
ncbi:cytochrome P450 [Meira miltonrushii]|uniref:Cytochrome P450 n=1 Tax=Meira miltonrushii TaxID=1280837 RepID=A0A316VHP4_9BASI|nr:cytochrome P450 [Meira miltonrushii]PWN37159.1 cytochrome P450 [Meira miltonrushii]